MINSYSYCTSFLFSDIKIAFNFLTHIGNNGRIGENCTHFPK